MSLIRRIIVGLMVVWLLIIPSVLFGQDDLTETFTASDGSFSFRYPEAWELGEEENGIVSLQNRDGALILTFFSPEVVSLLSTSSDLPDILDDFLAAVELEASDQAETEVGSRNAVQANLTAGGNSVAVLALPFSDGSVGILMAIGSKAGLRQNESLILEIAATFDSESGGSSTSEAAAALTDYASEPTKAMAELERLGLVPAGGVFVFGEDYAFFEGQGFWFTPLARTSPRTNIVMAGELTYEVGNADEIETCSLLSRIVGVNTSTTVNIFLNIGLTNSGDLLVMDRSSASGDANTLELVPLGLDAGEPHHLLMIVLNDKATVYVDGQLAIQAVAVDERAGTYGISLRGAGKGARCEGRDIWVYQIPSAEGAACSVSAGRNVNKRSGPGTNFANAGQLTANQEAAVIAQSKGSDGLTWWQLEDENWVREDVVSEIGDCFSVPISK